MRYKIPYGGALIGRKEKNAIMRIVNRNWWPAAKEADLMEKEAAKFLGMKYGILANSGSSAGLLALCALELPRHSEVVIPATTFPTIFNIIQQCSHIPVVVDTEVGTYNIDTSKLEKAISKKTRAIICVHAVGNPCDMYKITKLAKKYSKKYGHKIYVLEDNCDGWGGTLGQRKVGSFGDVSFTSFHAAHIVAMGQGGGVFTNSQEIARKVRMYRDWGRQSHIPRRLNQGKWPTLPADYDMRFIYEKLGYNLGPLELQAAMGRVQLRKTARIKRLRQKNFDYLYKHLSKHGELLMPHWVNGANPSWFAFPLSALDRGPLVEHLEKHGIETRSMFSGNILKHPGYLKVRHRKGTSLEGAETILKHSFWISCHPRLTSRDLKYIVQVFNTYYAKTS